MRRRRRTFWLDTIQPNSWSAIVGGPINDDAIAAVPAWTAQQMMFTRKPVNVETVSSVLQAKDEGFRLRRIVGDLVIQAGQIEDDQENRYLWSVHVGLIVMEMDDNGAPNDMSHVFEPAVATSMSDPWLYRRTYTFEHLSTQTLSVDASFAAPTNQTFDPVGSWLDIRVNRRVKPEQNLFWVFQWGAVQIPDTTFDWSMKTYHTPRFKQNLRVLISR